MSCLAHCIQQELTSAGCVSAEQSTLAITRKHLLLVDRYCILRSDVRCVSPV